MRYPFSKIDTALFLISSISTVFYIHNWSSFSTCAAPIQIFLTAAPFTIILMLIIFYLFRIFADRTSIRKYFDFLIIFILTPFSSYLAFQGIAWQIIIIIKSPKCSTGYFHTSWIWILLLWGVGFRYVKISFVMVKAYWRAYQETRTMFTMQELAEDGEYGGLDYSFWEPEEPDNEQMGLPPIDLRKFEKRFKKINLQENDLENCPICLVEFITEEKIVTLPKCEHTFHSECVTDWLKTNSLCPMCRGNVRNGIADVESNWYRPPEVIENF